MSSMQVCVRSLQTRILYWPDPGAILKALNNIDRRHYGRPWLSKPFPPPRTETQRRRKEHGAGSASGSQHHQRDVDQNPKGRVAHQEEGDGDAQPEKTRDCAHETLGTRWEVAGRRRRRGRSRRIPSAGIRTDGAARRSAKGRSAFAPAVRGIEQFQFHPRCAALRRSSSSWPCRGRSRISNRPSEKDCPSQTFCYSAITTP